MKTLTTKQQGEQYRKTLNSLEVFKINKIEAVNAQYYNDGTTKCEIYSRSTNKRFSIKTSILFAKPEFLKDMNSYILNIENFKLILQKN